MHLITIPFSHYNEKARWALERYGVAYREHRYMPLFHMPPAMLATWRTRGGRGDKVSTRYSTPILITDHGERLCDSHDIIRYLSDRFGTSQSTLYPTTEAAQLEQRFHDTLGPHARRVAYYYLMQIPDILPRLATSNVGRVQSLAFRAATPIIKKVLVDKLRINRAHAERSMDKLRQEVAEVSPWLEGRRYLVDDRFTAADLALASLLSILVFPPREDGFGGTLPSLSEMPAAFADFCQELRASAVGQHALRMYHEERRAR